MSIEDRLLAENQTLRDKIEVLERMLGTSLPVPTYLGLTPSEGRVFGMIAKRGAATRQQIWDALYGLRYDDAPDIKIVDIFTHKLRKKLRPHGVEIVTRWGEGYALEGEHLERAREILNFKEPTDAAASR